MIVNTHRLFARLLPRLRIDVVCDIGSMDGKDSLSFRDAVPNAKIFAFEANPENFQRMQADMALLEQDIQLVPLAVTDYDGSADFFLVEPVSGRGLSSLYSRADKNWAPPAGVVKVRTTRLDTFLAERLRPTDRLALWIDAEGKAYEVLAGAVGVIRQVDLLHVEVETSACIGSTQKLYRDVKAMLQPLGFEEFATDQSHRDMQFNVLFLRSELSLRPWLQRRLWLLDARLRQVIIAGIRKICPACLRRYGAVRSAAVTARRARRR